MPTYDFECPSCGNKVELIQRVKDPCPPCSCGVGDMKKLIGRTSFVLRGEGWARDLYTKRPVKNK